MNEEIFSEKDKEDLKEVMSMWDKCKHECTSHTKKSMSSNASSFSFVYCLGFIGAVIYYIQTATGFWDGVLGVLKAIVWPAMIVFQALEFFSL